MLPLQSSWGNQVRTLRAIFGRYSEPRLGKEQRTVDTLLYERLDATLGEYLKAFEETRSPGQPR
jgi:hypothetical protein